MNPSSGHDAFRFNIRVYGILINDQQQLLVSDEWIRGDRFTKFPGGRLEFGEGTRDCLKREFKEEMDLDIEVGAHLYTTDYFQLSAFDPGQQVISIYYYVKPLATITARLSETAFDFDERQIDAYNHSGQIESFRFIHWRNLSADDLTLPIDKIVVRLLKESR